MKKILYSFISLILLPVILVSSIIHMILYDIQKACHFVIFQFDKSSIWIDEHITSHLK